MMKLTWYGHSCFMLSTAQGDVVFDPYEPSYIPGLKLPEIEADLCLCSHGHGDHSYVAGVKSSGKDCDIKVKRIATYHDNKRGLLRGRNSINLIETEGKRIAHMGDLGHVLSHKQVESMGHIDLMMLPVGGLYTIDADAARQVVQQVKPEIVIPMHYRGEGFGFDNIDTVDKFAQLMDNVTYIDSSELEVDSIVPPAVIVLRCPAES